MLTGRHKLQALIAILLCTSTAQGQLSKPLVQAEISRQADTAHLEFKGLKNWRYEVQKSGDRKITVSVPPIDAASVARLQGFSDPLVESVKVDQNGADGSFNVHFNLASGEVESFDYLTDEPSRLIIDFYRKSTPVAAVAPRGARSRQSASGTCAK